MNVNGGDPRRAGQSQDYVLGADGQPLTDRYGRPIRKRPATGVPLERRRTTHERQPGQQAPGYRQQAPREQRQPPRNQQPPQGQNPRGQNPRGQDPRLQGHHQPPRGQQPPRYQQAHPGQPHHGQPPHGQPPHGQPPRYQQAPQGPPPRGPQAPSRHRRPQAAPSAYRRPRKKRSLASGLGCLTALIATLLVVVVVFMLWADTKLTRSDALDYPHVADTRGTNWLLVGSDSRQGLSEEQQRELGTGGDVGAGRTDTIMLLHIPRSGQATLVSIPRDSYVDIPGFGMDKINAAFAFGGAPLLGQTIEQWSGLKIDRYAEIGMGGLANVVDSVGGVEICVKEPIQDPLAGIDLQAGCQTLEGHNALGYVRTRATAMGDLDRVARQREFFTAILDKVTHASTLLNPLKVVSLVNHTAKSFVVGDKDHVWNLARLAWVMSSDVEKVTIPVDGFADTAVGNVVLWNDAETAALWESLKD